MQSCAGYSGSEALPLTNVAEGRPLCWLTGLTRLTRLAFKVSEPSEPVRRSAVCYKFAKAKYQRNMLPVCRAAITIH